MAERFAYYIFWYIYIDGIVTEKLEKRMKIGNRVEFGKCVKALRAKKGMAQKELAERVGLRQPHIARIEAGKHSCGIDQCLHIIKKLGGYIEIKEG